MRHWPAVLCVVVLAACSRSDGGTDAPITAWDDRALRAIARLAAGVNAAGLGCNDYTPYPFAPIADDYRGRLSLPAAMGWCETSEEESLEFAAFEDADAKERFIDEKRELLCKRSKESGWRNLGFPYVDGGTWVIQPDDPETAQQIARTLHAVAARADCSSAR